MTEFATRFAMRVGAVIVIGIAVVLLDDVTSLTSRQVAAIALIAALAWMLAEIYARHQKRGARDQAC